MFKIIKFIFIKVPILVIKLLLIVSGYWIYYVATNDNFKEFKEEIQDVLSDDYYWRTGRFM